MASSTYHVLQFECPPSTSELNQAILYANGCLGLEETDLNPNCLRLKAYFPDDQSRTDLEMKLAGLLHEASQFQTTTIGLNDIQFQPHTFDPLELAPSVWVIPPADMAPEINVKGETIIIRPGMGFGTGRHETTQIAAQLLNRLAGKPQTLLDVGTGSGILAIYGRKKGIEKVAACEIDGDARDNAKENFELNGLTGIRLEALIDDIPETFDVVVANIITSTLLFLQEKLLAHLKPGGSLILSGILESEMEQIKAAYGSLKEEDFQSKNEWRGFRFQKS